MNIYLYIYLSIYLLYSSSLLQHKQEQADEVKKKFSGDSESDHIAFLRAFRGWEREKNGGNPRRYCWDNFLAHNTLQVC